MEINLFGTLTSNETLCHEILVNNLNFCTINIPSPLNVEGTIDLELSTLKSEILNISIQTQVNPSTTQPQETTTQKQQTSTPQ